MGRNENQVLRVMELVPQEVSEVKSQLSSQMWREFDYWQSSQFKALDGNILKNSLTSRWVTNASEATVT